jgi:hypothetical protein
LIAFSASKNISMSSRASFAGTAIETITAKTIANPIFGDAQ